MLSKLCIGNTLIPISRQGLSCFDGHGMYTFFSVSTEADSRVGLWTAPGAQSSSFLATRVLEDVWNGFFFFFFFFLISVKKIVSVHVGGEIIPDTTWSSRYFALWTIPCGKRDYEGKGLRMFSPWSRQSVAPWPLSAARCLVGHWWHVGHFVFCILRELVWM